MRCSVLQWVAVRCSALLCVAVHCRALPCVDKRCCALPCVAVCCHALPCIAVRCRALPSVATWYRDTVHDISTRDSETTRLTHRDSLMSSLETKTTRPPPFPLVLCHYTLGNDSHTMWLDSVKRASIRNYHFVCVSTHLYHIYTTRPIEYLFSKNRCHLLVSPSTFPTRFFTRDEAYFWLVSATTWKISCILLPPVLMCAAATCVCMQYNQQNRKPHMKVVVMCAEATFVCLQYKQQRRKPHMKVVGCLRVCVCGCFQVCMCVKIHICTHIYTYMHIHVSTDSHTYTYIYVVRSVYRTALSATHCNTYLAFLSASE